MVVAIFDRFQSKGLWPLLLVLLIYGLLAGAHSLIAPLTVGNDEWAHFRYVRYIADHGGLPASWPAREEAGYKADAPPLYHLLVATVTQGVEPTRLLRPLDSPRRRLADNATTSDALLHTAVELPPYRGEVLIWHLGRFVSILFGMALIGVTYLTSRTLFRSRKRALLAAALLAFVPAFVFHSSVLSYESLSALFTALFLLAGIRALREPANWLWWLLMGLLAGLAVTTKYSALLLPLEIIFIAWLASRTRNDDRSLATIRARSDDSGLKSGALASRSSLRLFAWTTVAGLAMLLAVSWWFGFVIWRFNTIDAHGPVVGTIQPLLVGDASDTTSVNVAAFLFGRETIGAEQRSPLQRDYVDLMLKFADSFWAAPIDGQFVASPWLAVLFGLLILLAAVGVGRGWRTAGPATRRWLGLLLFHTLLVVPLLGLRLLFSFDSREVAQGRHLLLPAASAIPILLVWGWEQWSMKITPAAIGGLLLWSVLGQVGWAALTYPEPLPVWAEQSPDLETGTAFSVDETLGEGMRLAGATWHQPGTDSLEVTLWWEALALMSEDYLIELTLEDQMGRLVSVSVSHPVQGRFPTRAWEPGDVVKDLHWLPLIDPLDGTYTLRLRLLDREAVPVPDERVITLTSIELVRADHASSDACQLWSRGKPERARLWAKPYRVRSPLTIIAPTVPTLLPLTDESNGVAQQPLLSIGEFHFFVVGPDWAERYQAVIDSTTCPELVVDLPARNFEAPAIPQPLEVNFNNEIKLLGYDLPARRIQPGGRLPLTLYWQALDYMGEDYRIFDNLLDHEQQRWGGYDRRPRDGYSTLLWAPGEVVTDAFGVPVDPAAPPGVYVLDVGLYRPTEAGAVSLPIVVDGQPIDQTSIQLGPIKVGGPPPGLTTNDPAPQMVLNQPLGSQITLLGYDLSDGQQLTPPGEQSQPAGEARQPRSISGPDLKLTLYWRVEAAPQADYTTFVHLRDAANQNAVQKDRPPANGRYPTSLWDQGEVVIDEIRLPLEEIATGRYIPTVGLYDHATGERLPVPGQPANEIPLMPVEIQ